MKNLLPALLILGGGIAFTAVLAHLPLPPPSPSPAVLAEQRAERQHAAELRAAHIKEEIEIQELERQEDHRMVVIDRQVAAALAHRPSSRLPPDVHWGRCLLVVQGHTRISGKCAYTTEEGGFGIDGPRQVFAGIDYPEPKSMMEARSTDYWAIMFRDPDGTWDGYGNEDVEEVHGEPFGRVPLHHRGSCWFNKVARICLWRK